MLNILVDTSDLVGLLSGSPQYYGIAIHSAFGLVVKAEGLPGISPADVERSFDLPEGYSDVKDSVKPDVVLRDDAGDIIAIYDVKTGDRGIDPWREDELRAATHVDSTVPIIELRLY